MENLFKEFLQNYIDKLIYENTNLKDKIEIKNKYIEKLQTEIENLTKKLQNYEKELKEEIKNE